MYIPIYKRIEYKSDAELTRKLPAKGMVVVKEGDEVMPFTKLGRAKISNESMVLDPKIRLAVDDGEFVYKDDLLGRRLIKGVKAPYNGTLVKENGKYIFRKEKHDYWMLSGLWGSVKSIVPEKEVVVKTQVMNINFVACSRHYKMGEMIVFPNPTELLDLDYLEKFATSVEDKVIYVGHHIRREMVKRAMDFGVGALVGGSADKDVFDFAKRKQFSLGVITGFGKLETPSHIFEFIKGISNRHVFVDGYKGVLQIPVPPENDIQSVEDKKSLREVKQGLEVMVFTKDNFGSTGYVERVQEDVIHVKLNKPGAEKLLEVKVPNIFALV